MVKKEKEVGGEFAGKDLRYVILSISCGFAAIFIALAFLVGTNRVQLPLSWLDFAVCGTIITIGPYGFYVSARLNKIKRVERNLPDFLRDVAEAGRFGMTLADAIVVASTGRYGELTPEIKKMAAQIRWGVPATEALRRFAKRVNTPKVNRVTTIIIKASDAGGNVADVLSMVAHDVREDQLSTDERRIAMSTYVAVVYIAFFVFLITIVILCATLLPEMAKAGSQLPGTTGVTLVQPEYIPAVELVLIVSAIIHAVGDGILAGVLEAGKIAYGLRHSFIMLGIGYLMLRIIKVLAGY